MNVSIKCYKAIINGKRLPISVPAALLHVIAKNTGCEMSKMYRKRIALVLLVTETDIYFGPVINAVTPPDEDISTMIGQVLVQFLCSTTLFTSCH